MWSTVYRVQYFTHILSEGCRIGPQTRSNKRKIPETLGVNVVYAHVGFCRSFFTVLRGYGPILRHSCAHTRGPTSSHDIVHYKLTRHSTGLPTSTLPVQEKRAGLSMVENL